MSDFRFQGIIISIEIIIVLGLFLWLTVAEVESQNRKKWLKKLQDELYKDQSQLSAEEKAVVFNQGMKEGRRRERWQAFINEVVGTVIGTIVVVVVIVFGFFPFIKSALKLFSTS